MVVGGKEGKSLFKYYGANHGFYKLHELVVHHSLYLNMGWGRDLNA